MPVGALKMAERPAQPSLLESTAAEQAVLVLPPPASMVTKPVVPIWRMRLLPVSAI